MTVHEQSQTDVDT